MRRARARRFLRAPPRRAQLKVSTERATSPAFMARKASSMSSSRPRRDHLVEQQAALAVELEVERDPGHDRLPILGESDILLPENRPTCLRKTAAEMPRPSQEGARGRPC